MLSLLLSLPKAVSLLLCFLFLTPDWDEGLGKRRGEAAAPGHGAAVSKALDLPALTQGTAPPANPLIKVHLEV